MKKLIEETKVFMDTPEYKEMIARKNFENKWRVIFIATLLPSALIVAALVKSTFDIQNDAVVWILGFAAIFGAIAFAHDKTQRTFQEEN